MAASLFQGIFVTRLLIRSLDAEHYGMWVLVFTILDYFWFFDLGLNTAVANFCARFRALNQVGKINEVISTALFSFSIVALCVWITSPVLAWQAHRFFKILPRDQAEFGRLILIVGISWGLCIMLHMFISALDAFQRFDLSSRVMVIQVVLRSIGYYIALKTHHGLIMMAEIYVATQILGYLLNFLNFRRIFPDLRVSRDLIRWPMLRDIFRYGLKSFVANAATLGLNGSGPVMVGHYLGQSAVGFYMLPARLLQQAVDPVSRIAMVTRANAAELSASSRREELISLGVYVNRYSLTLFMPLACFLLMYGQSLVDRWVGGEMAEHSGPLLPVFLLSYGVAAAQFNSSSVLYGLGRHGGYARGLVIEAVLCIAGLAWVVPRFGIWGGAWVTAICLIANRGIYTPWLVSRALEYPFRSYLSGTYLRPLLAAAPALAIAYAARATVLPGHTWAELIAAGCLTASTYLAVALFACFEPHHRHLMIQRIPVLGPRLASRA